MSDVVMVARSNHTVDRDDVCQVCGGPMLYYCPLPSGEPLAMFCEKFECERFLQEIPLAAPKGGSK